MIYLLHNILWFKMQYQTKVHLFSKSVYIYMYIYLCMYVYLRNWGQKYILFPCKLVMRKVSMTLLGKANQHQADNKSWQELYLEFWVWRLFPSLTKHPQKHVYNLTQTQDIRLTYLHLSLLSYNITKSSWSRRHYCTWTILHNKGLNFEENTHTYIITTHAD